MTPVREAFVLPVLLITATLLGSVHPGAPVAFVPPPLYALVLAALLLGALVQSGALDPARLMHGSRSMLANANGVMVLVSLVAAAAAVFAAVTPGTGLPRFFVCVFLFVLVANTLVARPDRVRLLRSIAVILGSALILKYGILASLSEPSGSTTSRVLVALFDAATFGSIAQVPEPASAGYAAFFAIALFLAATAFLSPPRRSALAASSPLQLPDAG